MPSPSSPRFGVVDYANVAPLVAGLPVDSIRRAVPSRVAGWLAAGEVDLATLPTIELGRVPGCRVAGRWGVAASGRCDSVLLFARRPLGEVRSVVLDASSRTAAALTRVLLDREGAKDVTYSTAAEGSLDRRLADADAALLIGDPALLAEVPTGVTPIDLAAEWRRHVGLPFVFAAWASRPGREPTAQDSAVLGAAAERGLARLPELAELESARTGLSAARLEAYFRQLDYRLDDDHLRGLGAFLDEAHRIGILEERATVRFDP